MTDSTERLAEAAHAFIKIWPMTMSMHKQGREVRDALAAFDADRERRQAEQRIVVAAAQYADGDAGNVRRDALRDAVRRWRDLS